MTAAGELPAKNIRPAADNEEARLLDLLKTNPKEAFELMVAEISDFSVIESSRFLKGTKLARFGSNASPAKILYNPDKLPNRMMIVLEGLNTEELMRQVSLGTLNFSGLEKMSGSKGSNDNFVLEIDGSKGSKWQIQAGIARIDIGRMQYADAVPYLQSQIVAQNRVRPGFSEQALRRYIIEKFGTAEALAYVFTQLKAGEESGNGIRKMTREDYLRVYGPRPKRKSYYYADW